MSANLNDSAAELAAFEQLNPGAPVSAGAAGEVNLSLPDADEEEDILANCGLLLVILRSSVSKPFIFVS